MFYDKNENNQKSISLVSIIVIILAGLLIVGAIVVDTQSSLTLAERVSKNQQEVYVVQEEKQNKDIKTDEGKENQNNQNLQQDKAVKQSTQDDKKEDKKEVEEDKNKAQEKVKKDENKTENSAQVPTQPKEQETAPVENTTGRIFLTFDDGPSDSTTGRLLDILKKYNVKATFFVTGKGSDELIKREYNEGHSIGLHTYSHSYKAVYESEEAYFDDLAKVEQRVYNAVGIHSKIVRFPGGASNTVSKFNPGIMTRLSKQLTEKGYKYWDWNVSSGDAGDTTNPDKIFANVTNNCSKDKRNIVLMHDIHEYTINSIERIIIWAKENNYEFCKIEENMDPVHHRIAN